MADEGDHMWPPPAREPSPLYRNRQDHGGVKKFGRSGWCIRAMAFCPRNSQFLAEALAAAGVPLSARRRRDREDGRQDPRPKKIAPKAGVYHRARLTWALIADG